MNKQILSLFLLTALLLSLAVVSAAVGFSVSTPSSLSKSINSTTFTITNNNASNNVTVVVPSSVGIIQTGGSNITVSLSPSGNVQVGNGSSRTITASYSSLPSTIGLGVFTQAFTIVDSTNSSDTQSATLSFTNGFCSEGPKSNGTTRYLEIISVKDTSSDNDWEWKPADEVNIDVKVRYNNDLDSDDSIDAIIEIALFDSNTNKFVDIDNEEDLEQQISLDEGSSETQSFTLQVPVQDIEDSSGRYKLYVKVYEDGEEKTLCNDLIDGSESYKSVDITKQSYEVILNKLEVATSSVICGVDTTISGTAWNIGGNDEDKVYVNLYNRELGLNINSSTFSLDQGDSQKINFDFVFPKNASKKEYIIYLTPYYRYSKSSEEFREHSESAYELKLTAEECFSETRKTSITAVLSSDTPKAVIGNQVIVEATILNNGTSEASYSVDVTGNSQWSEIAGIDPKTFSLRSGESKKVLIYMDISNSATEGDKEFTIRTTSGSSVTEQKVIVTLEKGFSSSALAENFKKNWIIYTIVIVNIILIIAIIIVVVRIFQRDSD